MYNNRNVNVALIDHTNQSADFRPMKGWPDGSKVCSACRSVFEGKQESKKEVNRIVLCPECLRRKKEEIPSGYVYLKGEFLTKHYKDLDLLVKIVARRAERENPADKILE